MIFSKRYPQDAHFQKAQGLFLKFLPTTFNSFYSYDHLPLVELWGGSRKDCHQIYSALCQTRKAETSSDVRWHNSIGRLKHFNEW